jgi:hypothetical protein
MGLGCVLVVWLAFFAIAALPVGALLMFWSRRNARGTSSSSKLRGYAAGLLPIGLIPIGVVWFIGYAVYCDYVRHVDPGLGDVAVVPLSDGYRFCMIDVPDKGFIMKDGCTGTPPIDDVTQLTQIGDRIVGSAEKMPGFVLDMRTNATTVFPTLAAALAQFSPPPALQSADAFYQAHRWALPDLFAVLLLLGMCGVVSWAWYRAFIRRRN